MSPAAGAIINRVECIDGARKRIDFQVQLASMRSVGPFSVPVNVSCHIDNAGIVGLSLPCAGTVASDVCFEPSNLIVSSVAGESAESQEMHLWTRSGSRLLNVAASVGVLSLKSFVADAQVPASGARPTTVITLVPSEWAGPFQQFGTLVVTGYSPADRQDFEIKVPVFVRNDHSIGVASVNRDRKVVDQPSREKLE